jgi:hypothetical protein
MIDWDSFKLKACTVQMCTFADIRHIFEGNHYKAGHMGGSIAFCFALGYEGVVIGGAVYGPPRHAGSYGKGVTDLRRFALVEEAPRNTESYFLGKTLKEIAKAGLADKVLTFADETQGHLGTIYKACNFKYLGATPPGKHVMWKGKQYHTRSLTTDRPYSYLLREAVKTGEAVIVQGLRKHKYMYDVLDIKRSVALA